MPPQFNNMSELTSYLDAMEKRVQTLEGQNEDLKQGLAGVDQAPARELPRTALLSRRYFKRAFTVWGHYFVANFIIALAISVIAVTVLLVAGLVPSFTAYFRSLLGF